MGHSKIGEIGKPYRFSSTNQPAVKGTRKGVRNRSTVAKEILNLPLQYKDHTGKMQQGTIEDAMYAAQARKAIQKGDTFAFNALLDSAYGKARQTIEVTENEPVEYNYDNLTDEELELLARLQRKALGRNPDGTLIERQGAEDAEIVE